MRILVLIGLYRKLICRIPDIRLNNIDKTYRHFWSLFHSYFILSEKILKKFSNSKFASFVQQFNRISGQSDIRQMKPDIRPDTGYKKRLNIQSDIQYNPNTNIFAFHILGLDVCVHPWFPSASEIWASWNGSGLNIHSTGNIYMNSCPALYDIDENIQVPLSFRLRY